MPSQPGTMLWCHSWPRSPSCKVGCGEKPVQVPLAKRHAVVARPELAEVQPRHLGERLPPRVQREALRKAEAHHGRHGVAGEKEARVAHEVAHAAHRVAGKLHDLHRAARPGPARHPPPRDARAGGLRAPRRTSRQQAPCRRAGRPRQRGGRRARTPPRRPRRRSAADIRTSPAPKEPPTWFAVAVREGHGDRQAAGKLRRLRHHVAKAGHGVDQQGALTAGHHVGAVLEGVGQLPDALGDGSCGDELGHGWYLSFPRREGPARGADGPWGHVP